MFIYQAKWQNVIHDRMAQKSLNPTRLLDLLDLRIDVREGCSHGIMISQGEVTAAYYSFLLTTAIIR